MKRAWLLSALALLLVVSLASVASAGEVKGPPGELGAEGGPTPVAGFWSGDGAASICSFSGLNDEITTEGEFPEPTQTQSYGTFLVLIKKSEGISAQEAKELLGESPGHECNPNRALWGNPKK
jgi:hypothetical protein